MSEDKLTGELIDELKRNIMEQAKLDFREELNQKDNIIENLRKEIIKLNGIIAELKKASFKTSILYCEKHDKLYPIMARGTVSMDFTVVLEGYEDGMHKAKADVEFHDYNISIDEDEFSLERNCCSGTSLTVKQDDIPDEAYKGIYNRIQAAVESELP